MTTLRMAGARALDDLAGEAARRALELRGLKGKGARARKKKALADFICALQQAGASAKRSAVPAAERGVHACFSQVRNCWTSSQATAGPQEPSCALAPFSCSCSSSARRCICRRACRGHDGIAGCTITGDLMRIITISLQEPSAICAPLTAGKPWSSGGGLAAKGGL